MTNLQKKVYIDNFRLVSSGIEAFCLIDGESVDFHINTGDFETFCDDNELRFYEVNIPGNDLHMERDLLCQHSWPDIYEGYELMVQFLKAYIEYLYDQEKWDIGTPLKQILNSF